MRGNEGSKRCGHVKSLHLNLFLVHTKCLKSCVTMVAQLYTKLYFKSVNTYLIYRPIKQPFNLKTSLVNVRE